MLLHVDLYGLLYFLGAGPYDKTKWFNELIWLPYTRRDPHPMISLFTDLMWRNSKEDVADEVCTYQLLILHNANNIVAISY